MQVHSQKSISVTVWRIAAGLSVLCIYNLLPSLLTYTVSLCGTCLYNLLPSPLTYTVSLCGTCAQVAWKSALGLLVLSNIHSGIQPQNHLHLWTLAGSRVLNTEYIRWFKKVRLKPRPRCCPSAVTNSGFLATGARRRASPRLNYTCSYHNRPSF